MNHKEALSKLSDEQLNKILKKLKIEPFKGATKIWIAVNIAAFYQDIKKFRLIIPSAGERTINDLLLYAHINKPFTYEQVQLLNDYGILIEGELPYDLKNRLVQWSRSFFIKTFPLKSEESQQSFFLQCILLLHYFEREKSVKLTSRKKDRNVRLLTEELFIDRETIWKALNALVISGLVSKTNNLYELDIERFTIWKKEPKNAVLESFYKEQAGNRILLFLDKISHYQRTPEEWVDITIISETSIEFDQARQLGLTQVHRESGRTYIQLMPESWYITKKQIHPLWNQPIILISASFEIFVPYHYNPFILLELLPVCRMKDSYYFLVFNIDVEQAKKNKQALQKFYDTLIKCSSAIPDVVDYELKRL